MFASRKRQYFSRRNSNITSVVKMAAAGVLLYTAAKYVMDEWMD